MNKDLSLDVNMNMNSMNKNKNDDLSFIRTTNDLKSMNAINDMNMYNANNDKDDIIKKLENEIMEKSYQLKLLKDKETKDKDPKDIDTTSNASDYISQLLIKHNLEHKNRELKLIREW